MIGRIFDRQNRTGEQDRHIRTGRTGLPKRTSRQDYPDRQNRTAMKDLQTGFPGQDCREKEAEEGQEDEEAAGKGRIGRERGIGRKEERGSN